MHILKKILFFAVFTALNIPNTLAQYSIEMNIKNFAEKEAYLIQYFGDQRYIAAKAKSNKKGKLIFSNEKSLHEGVYMINLDKEASIDIILDKNQKFEVNTDFLDPKKTTIKGSVINSKFIDYQQENYNLQSQIQKLEKQKDEWVKSAPKHDSIPIYLSKMDSLEEKIDALYEKTSKENEHNFLGVMLYTMRNSDIKKIDLNDNRLLYTPFFYNIIRLHIKENIQKSHTYIIQENDKVIQRIQDSDMRNYIVSYLLDFYATFAKSGGDEIVVHLADKYFLSGLIPMDEAPRKSLEKKIDKLRISLPGSIAKDLKICNIQGDSINIHSIDNNKVLLLFWSSHCGHCEDAINYLKPHYAALKSKDIEIIGIATDDDQKEWLDFLHKHPLPWPNFVDANNNSNFRQIYYIFSTPLLYYLNNEKKIVSRHMGNDEIEQLIESLIAE